MVGPYIRGKLRLAGVDLRTPLGDWLDAVYAAYLDAPHEFLADAHRQTVIAAARRRPDRETWGIEPDHIALGKGLTGPAPGH